MVNLLPPEMQSRLKRDERASFLEAFALVALACGLIACIALVPGFVALRDLKAAQERASSAAAQEDAADRSAVSETKNLMAQVQPLTTATTTLTSVIAQALSQRPSGVSVDTIDYAAGDPSQLTLSGAAGDPSSIDAYRRALTADPIFSDVSIPVGALVGAGGGRFTITLTGDF